VSTPVRYASRYGSLPPGEGEACCLTCGAPLRSTRAQYCSPGCKQRAYRLRQGDRATQQRTRWAGDLQRPQRRVAQTIYECSECGERYLGERRCADCNRFCRALGRGGACPHCDQPILAAELLGEEGRS
jgi:hypothetical protein